MIYRLRKLVSGALTCAIAILVLATPALCRQIEFWTTGHSSATTKWIDEELLPRFQKERRIQVVHKNVRMSAEVEAELLSGAGPDVLIDSATNMVRFGRGNTLEPLARYLTRWKDQKTLFPNLLKAPYPKLPSLETEPITMYALPIEVMPSGIAFNKDAFSRAGLSATNTPNSWQELEAAAKKTVLRWDNRVVRPGLDANWSGFDLFLNFLRLNGETGVTNDYRKARLDTDRAAETLNYLAGLYQLAYPPSELFPGTQPNRGNPSRFADGMAAMAYGGPYLAVYTTQRNPKWQKELGFFPARRTKSAEPAAWTTMKAIGITRASRDPMGAWDFIEWLFTPDIAVLYHQNTGSVPSRNDLTSRITKSAPHLAGWYQAVKYGFVMEAYGSAWNRNRDLVLQALMGRIDARSALAQINGQYQMALDDLWATSGTR